MSGKGCYDAAEKRDSYEIESILNGACRASGDPFNAGVDILLKPVGTAAKEGIAEPDTYISRPAQMAESGEIPMERINASVLRILKLKEHSGLFTPYDGSDIEARVRAANSS